MLDAKGGKDAALHHYDRKYFAFLLSSAIVIVFNFDDFRNSSSSFVPDEASTDIFNLISSSLILWAIIFDFPDNAIDDVP